LKPLILDYPKINEAKLIENEIDTNTKKISQLVEEKIYNRELYSRFNILKRQYQSDLSRLSFILEAESLTSQLPSHLCPICSNPIEKDEVKHIMEIENFKSSVLVESEIIEKKILDLDVTISITAKEFEEIQDKYNSVHESLEIRKEKLGALNPEITKLKNVISNLLSNEKLNNRIEFIDSLLKKYYFDKDKLNNAKSQKETTEIVNICDYELLNQLSISIENRLKSWNFDNGSSVIFNSETKIFDIIISGKGRGSYGSGRRAISYSACVLGILDYCINNKLNFHNFVLLDSPLSTFRKAVEEGSESTNEDLVSLFFRDLETSKQSSQIIIVDKTEVPNIVQGVNVIKFTKNSTLGRYGFIPSNNETA